MSEENDNQKLSSVPQWWWDYGMKEEMDKRMQEAGKFDRLISNGRKAPKRRAKKTK